MICFNDESDTNDCFDYKLDPQWFVSIVSRTPKIYLVYESDPNDYELTPNDYVWDHNDYELDSNDWLSRTDATDLQVDIQVDNIMFMAVSDVNTDHFQYGFPWEQFRHKQR